ncbi:MAG: outer membrane beta-barrel protein [Bacteroidaceae bacterium]|nr:outer membrane beta-barrel protein [Bacteroidaceae bacterium]
MKYSKFIAVLAAQCLLFASLAQAQEKKEKKLEVRVFAYVMEETTGMPVPGVKVSILRAKDSTLVNSDTVRTYNNSYFASTSVRLTLSEPGEFLVKCEGKGYETTYNHWTVDKLYKHEDVLRVATPWYIRRAKKTRKDVKLGEAVVKASRVKFYYKGDTIVYDADAFELAEGSMLDALIKQLPGVELKEGGEITVQGRRVDELLLNGRDFLNSDRKDLLNNLPIYMVKNIKVFEKTTREQEIMGDTINKLLAMDVRLKKEYNRTFVGNIEGGLGTNHTALGRFFALGFTPKSSFKVHAMANNLNDVNDPGEQGEGTPLKQATSVYNIYRLSSFYHYTDDKFNYQNTIQGRYTENKSDSYTNSENFLSSGNTFGRRFARGRNYSSSFWTNHTFYIKNDILLGPVKVRQMRINPNFSYNDNRGHHSNGSATTDQDIYGVYGKEWRDSITAPNTGQLLRTYGLNRTKNNSRHNGYALNASSTYGIHLAPAHDNRFVLYLNGKTDFQKEVERLYEHYNLEYLQTANRDFRNRHTYDKAQGLMHSIELQTSFFSFLDNLFSVSLVYQYQDKKQIQNRSLYLLNKLDAWGEETGHPLGELPSVDEMLLALDNGNSYRQQQDSYNNRVAPHIYIYPGYNEKSKVSANIWIIPGISFSRERLHYERAAIDTLVRRNQRNFDFSSGISLYPKGNSWPTPWHVSLSYNINVNLPNMTYLVDYRDDSNPLNIMLGNPNLRNTRTHKISVEFRRNMEKQRQLNSSVVANIYRHRLAMGYIYDTRTGVRTVTPDNVNGNWDLTGRINYSARLDKDGKFTYSTSTDATYTNSVDLIEQLRSEVHTTNINETLKLNMRFSAKASLNVKADLHYMRATSDREDFSTINVADFDYGVGGVFQIPFGFQFSTDMTMYSRRGYNDHSMNTNELVWNARLSRHFAKAGLTVMLDAFDLLGNLSNVRRTINAQGRTETWSNVTPQYAMLHVLYRLNKKPKKTE